jgi:cell division protein FtsB
MRRFDLAVTCVCCALLGYFAWHDWKGPRGYANQEALKRQVAALQQTLEERQQTRIRLEHRVGLLRPESIDPDLLDELARSRLDMTAPGDVVAFTQR